MTIFYSSTLLVMICLLVGAFLLLLAEAGQQPNLWLIAFLGSLILNTTWAFLGPILHGWEQYYILNVGNIANRLAASLGYAALFLYVVALRRKK